ncbi:MAG TPA: hypothetical protein DEO88_08380, partial [Syntrophobacteraceae bacterium]|nr:hypothetical protein [Syntrophobacteraceae bacterium]
FPKHLPTQIRVKVARGIMNEKATVGSAAKQSSTLVPEHFPQLEELLSQAERQYLQEVVVFTKGNMREACRISGLSRSRFYERIKKFGIRYDPGLNAAR